MGKIFLVRYRGLELVWDIRMELLVGGFWREIRLERNVSLVWGILVRNLCFICSGSDFSIWFG